MAAEATEAAAPAAAGAAAEATAAAPQVVGAVAEAASRLLRACMCLSIGVSGAAFESIDARV